MRDRVRRRRRRAVTATGSCRSRWAGWRRSATAARSGRTASRATAPAWRCRSRRRCSSCSRAARRPTQPAVAMLFLPRGRAARDARPARSLGEALATEGLASRRGGACRSTPPRSARRLPRRGPTSPRRSSAARSTPARGRPIPDAEFERRLVLARRRLESAARAEGLDDLSVAVDVVPDRRLQGPRRRRPPRGVLPGPGRPDRAQPRALPPALRDEHPADLAARPAVPLDRPQRRDRHGPRQPRAGPGPDRRRRRGRAAAARATLVEAGPLLSPDGSDSQSLDEMVELLVATGWDLGSALLAAMPEASSLRRAPHPHVGDAPAGDAPGCSPRGTARPRSSSPTAAGSGRSSTATGSGRRPSR